MNTKLLNFLAQNFKEKRLIFMAPGAEAQGDDDDSADDSADDDDSAAEGDDDSADDDDSAGEAPDDAPEAAADAAAKAEAEARAAAATDVAVELTTTDEVEARTIEGGEIMVSASMPDFIYQDDQGNDYTAPEAYLMPGDIRKLKDSGTYEYRTNDDSWIEFAPPDSWAEAASAAPAAAAPAATDEAAEAAEQTRLLAEAKDRITAAEAHVTEKREKITLKGLRDGIKGRLEGDDEDLKDKIAEILFPDESGIDSDFAAAAKILEDAKALDDPAAIDQKIAEAVDSLRNEGHYIEDVLGRINQFKPLLAIFDKYKELAGDGANAKPVIDKIRTAIIQDLATDNVEIIPDKIKSDFNEELAIAVVADMIEKTPDEFKGAIRYYKLGKYKTADETHPDYVKNQAILQAFVAKKGEIKERGITFDFFGSTNNVDHRLTKDPAWHKEKAAALTKILELNTAGRLQVDPAMTQFITDNKALIEQYTAAVAAGAGYVELVTAKKDKFLKGGTIFDLALRLQRAAEFKRFVEGKPEPEEGKAHTDIFTTDDTDKVALLHQNDDSAEGMKSGIKFGISEETPTADEEEGDDAGGTDTVEQFDTDHKYFIEEEGRKLKVTFVDGTEGGYKIENPDGLTLTVDRNDAENFIMVKSADDKQQGTFQFDPAKNLFQDEVATRDNIWDTYDVKLDGEIIKITRKAAAAPAEGAEETDQAIYELTTNGIDVHYAGEDEPTPYTINKPDEVHLKEMRNPDNGDTFVGVEAETGGTKYQGYFEFEANKKFKTGRIKGHENVWGIYRFVLEGNNITISKITAPADAGAADAAAAPGDAAADAGAADAAAGAPADAPNPGEALEAKDRETTVALRAKLTEAKAEIDGLITEFEGTIGTNEGLAPAVEAQVAEKKATMEATFEQVKGKLQEAVDETNRGVFGEAQEAYREAERIITAALDEQMEPDLKEALLSSESTAAIAELREAVGKHKGIVEDAFAEKIAAAQALEAAPAAAE